MLRELRKALTFGKLNTSKGNSAENSKKLGLSFFAGV